MYLNRACLPRKHRIIHTTISRLNQFSEVNCLQVYSYTRTALCLLKQSLLEILSAIMHFTVQATTAMAFLFVPISASPISEALPKLKIQSIIKFASFPSGQRPDLATLNWTV